jgi:ATP-binding protein involved in chromosome partitioning
VKAALQDFQDPETGRSVVTMDQVGEIQVTDSTISLTLGLTSYSAPLWQETLDQAKEHVHRAFPEAREVHVRRGEHHRPAEKVGELGLQAKSVIAVGSGKGGVGKSTVAAALAHGLQRAGSQTGLLDADVYGPSIPHLMGIDGRPEVVENRIQPVAKDGVRVMSMGFFVPEGEAVIWRGPMLHGTITQFLRDTAWGELDYLIIDMPPGTGDVALTLSQLLPLSGAVVVCTPQELALLDAVKAIAMFRKVNIPVAGMVENMSGFVCPDCQKRYDIFGRGGAGEKATELEVPLLGELPINMQIRTCGDQGGMAQLFEDDTTRPHLEGLVCELARNLAERAKDSPSLPSLTVL